MAKIKSIDYESFTGLVCKAIEDHIADEVEKQVTIAQDKLKNKIPEIIAGVSIRVLERIPMERCGRDLIIHGVFEEKG